MTRHLVVGAGLCVTLLASCTAGHTRAAATSRPATFAAATVTTAPIPTSVHASSVKSLCPDRLPDTPANGGVPRVDMVLVSIAAVRADVCEYAGSTTSPALTGHVAFTDGAAAVSTEDAVNVLPATDPLTGSACAPNPDSGVLVILSDGLHAEEERAALSGCREITNGYLRSAPTPYWTALLRRLVATADQCARTFGIASGCSAGGR